MSDFLDQIMGGDYFTAVCDECRTIKSFTSARARELWENNHPHVDPC
jgi:hypothetical protein